MSVAVHLADNVRALREARGLTQAQVARAAGVPRPTWANLESGQANPTLAVLLRVAAALQVSVEELISPPRAVARLFRAESLPARKRGRALVRKVLPDPMSGLDIERIELPVAWWPATWWCSAAISATATPTPARRPRWATA
jgi:transcriptional regulator with XRE-family HTH domain